MSWSILSKIIDKVTKGHQLDAVTDKCKAAKEDCELKSGHEVTFVNLIADYLFRRIADDANPNLNYHHWVYIPSLRAERKVGYDLSIGLYHQRRRIRSMHKLLLSWCDTRRSWSLKPGSGDHIHLANLYQDWTHTDELIKPFLVIHTCYCIHDYRRMGLALDDLQVTLPGIDSLLRTVVIPLEHFFKDVAKDNLDIQQTSLRYRRIDTRAQKNEATQTYFDRIAHRQNHSVVAEIGVNYSRELEIQSVSEWGDKVVKFFHQIHQ